MAAGRFLLDRSLGQRKLVTQLRGSGWDVVSLAEHFGDERSQRMLDQEWISGGAEAGFILLTKDHMIASRPLEAMSIYLNDARVVAFARGDLTAEQMGSMCLQFAPQIHRLATVHPPFVFSLSMHGLRRKRLNWQPN